MSELAVKWIAPDTTETLLSGESYFTALEGDKGLYMPNVSLLIDYFQRHAVLSRVRFEPRIITLPLRIETSTQAEMDSAIDALCKAFSPVSSVEGTLQVTRHDGKVRQIKGIYFDGLEGVRSKDNYHQLWFNVTIGIKCSNHLWFDPTAVTKTYSTGTPGTWFPFFPLQLSAGAIFGSEVVTNPGTAEAWPVWEVDGPATNPEFHNITTGKVLKLVLSVLTGETLVIDTRPGVKTVTIGAVNKFSTISVDSSLWPLEPGNQTIKTVLSGTDSNSEVRLEFNPRYVSL